MRVERLIDALMMLSQIRGSELSIEERHRIRVPLHDAIMTDDSAYVYMALAETPQEFIALKACIKSAIGI